MSRLVAFSTIAFLLLGGDLVEGQESQVKTTPSPTPGPAPALGGGGAFPVENGLIVLRANRLSKRGEAASPPPLGPLDPPPTRNASLSRRRAGDGLERASPTLSLAQPDQVIIRTIDPTGPLLPGGRGALQLWWEDSDPASENRARAAYGLSRGKVGAKDPDEGEETFFLDDWGLGRPATRVTISKTRSGRPCVTLGVPHPMDKACGRP